MRAGRAVPARRLVSHAAFVSCLLVAAVLAALLMASCGGTASDSDGVKGVLSQEVTAVNHKDWKAAYDAESPRARSVCTYGDYLKAAQSVYSRIDVTKLAAKDVKVIVTGDTATATYTTVYNGEDVQSNDSNPDTFIKVYGRWYDDNKGNSACSTS